MAMLIFGCTQPMPGSDRDSHGCIPSAGYSWCDAKQACIRPWEENCTATNQTAQAATEAQARAFCGQPNVDSVFICGPYVRVVSSLMGGGSTFYQGGAEIARCPVVSPDAMSGQCRQLLLGNNCAEQKVDCPQAAANASGGSPIVGNQTDSHGCVLDGGYSWCGAKQKCLRVWEEPCEGAITVVEAQKIAENSSCMAVGNLTGTPSYNNVTKTWWFDLDTVKPGCSPACVVFEANLSAGVNWRCTGLLPGYTVKTANSSLGEILTDGDGMTLYTFASDSVNKSACTGACAKNWPPLLVTDHIIQPAGIAGTFGILLRDDSTVQVTYNGMPLYRYAADHAPGDTNGEGVIGKWHVARP